MTPSQDLREEVRQWYAEARRVGWVPSSTLVQRGSPRNT